MLVTIDPSGKETAPSPKPATTTIIIKIQRCCRGSDTLQRGRHRCVLPAPAAPAPRRTAGRGRTGRCPGLAQGSGPPPLLAPSGRPRPDPHPTPRPRRSRGCRRPAPPAPRRVKCGAPTARNKSRACAQGLRTQRGRRHAGERWRCPPAASEPAGCPLPAARHGSRPPHAPLARSLPASARQLSPQFWPSRSSPSPLCPSISHSSPAPSPSLSARGQTGAGPARLGHCWVLVPAPAQRCVPRPTFCPGSWWAFILLLTSLLCREAARLYPGAPRLWPLPGGHPS